MEKKQEQKRLTFRSFIGLGEVAGYFFRGKDPNRPNNFNIRMMHGINKISILIFLGALIVWLLKRFVF